MTNAGPTQGFVPGGIEPNPQHSEGVRNLAEIIRGTSIQTLILWKHNLEIQQEGYRGRCTGVAWLTKHVR